MEPVKREEPMLRGLGDSHTSAQATAPLQSQLRGSQEAEQKQHRFINTSCMYIYIFIYTYA